jgi:cell division protein FtsW (lipid II flippase)
MSAWWWVLVIVLAYTNIGIVVGVWWASYDVYENLDEEQFNEFAAQAVMFWPVVLTLYILVRMGAWQRVAKFAAAPVNRWHEGTTIKLENERKRSS